MSADTHQQVKIRHDLRPGDIGRITLLHGELYAREYGFDHQFEAYVAEGLGQFGHSERPGQDRIWIAELDDRIVGSITMIGREQGEVQLRWFLVHPETRGRGLGRQLVSASIAFAREAGYRSIYLWTVHVLTDAARLYTAAGFRLTEQKPMELLWGQTLAEQRYDLTL